MKIVCIEPLGLPEDQISNYIKRFKQNDLDFEYYSTIASTIDEKISRIGDAEILMVVNQKIEESVLMECPNLRMISVAFTGIDHLPLDYCKERNITITNAAGYSTHSVAELTLGLAISLLRNIPQEDSNTRALKSKSFLGSELYGKTVGVIGYGNIGKRVAQLFNSLGCNVVISNRTVKDSSLFENMSLDKLLTVSDIVTIHLPLTPETKLLINEDRLKLMKPNAILINTARGPVVDSDALAMSLNAGKIAGAAIDVYEVEPPIPENHPLLNAPNTILLPHIAYYTIEALKRRADIACENAIGYAHKVI